MAGRGVAKIYKVLNEDLTHGTSNWDTLTVSRGSKAQQRSIYSLSTDAPLAAKWKPMSLNRMRWGKTGDFLFLREGIWVVSPKAVEILKPFVKDTVEFLPATIVGDVDPITDKVTQLAARDTQKVFVARPLRLIELADGAKADLIENVFDADVGEEGEPLLEVWCYAFHPAHLDGLHLFRVACNDVLLASKAVRDAVSKAKLTGVEFVDLEYKTPSEAKAMARQRAGVKPPKSFDFDKLGDKPKISKALWKSWVDHWKWLCAAVETHGGDASEAVLIAKPISEKQMACLQKKMGMELPREFADVLCKYSHRVSFFWCDGEHDDLPVPLCDVTEGGQNPMWDADRLVEFAAAAKDHANSPWLALCEGLRDRLPFMEVGNGDLIAFDMREGGRNCPVVYLSHDNDEGFHDRRLGVNFVDFMTRWTNLGCPGPDYGGMLPFYSNRLKLLNSEGRLVKRWRRWLTEGK